MSTVQERVREAMSKPAPTEFERDPSACRANGCPCRGTVDLGNSGRFVCAWHAWADGDRWPVVTEALERHLWLVEHIAELQRLYRVAGSGKPWIVAADTFWRNEPDMQPQPIERDRWSMYVWRLREELAYRVGVRKDRPAARTPQVDGIAGAAA